MQTLYSENASRKINGQAVLQAIVQANAPVSRAELARELGLSKQTLSEIMGLLEQTNWIKPAGRKQGALGRAALSYVLNADAGYVVGLIFEGEQYALGLADMRGDIRVKKTGQLNPNALNDGAFLGEHLISLVRGLIVEAEISPSALRYMVVGCPGGVDPVTMRIHHSPNLPALQGLDLKRVLSGHFECPALLDNDLNLHAYGEYRYGCSQNTSSSVFIGLGTGVGMGIMLGDQIWRGSRGGAGEIGYLPVAREVLEDEEKTRGALEFSLNKSRNNFVQATQESATYDETYAEYMDKLARDCAFAIAGIMPILDPEVVVLGGALGNDAQLHAMLPKWLHSFSADSITVRKSGLGQDAGLLGAIALALQETQIQLFASQS